MIKSSVLHARFGTEAEFADPNNVIPAGILCVVQDEDGATTGFKFGDGVTEYTELTTVLTPLDAPLAAVAAPTGGATVDAEARTAINAIRARLVSLGFIEA